ncbi:MAG TPA: helix-turn-helix domain-containing protein [Phycisphaerae bacterium]|nr:helix-turn-helix domain-containing protein [Phycisphaerae bacterium]
MAEALTPPKLAERYGVSPDKVLRWITAGEIRAVNIATNPRGRPRWVIPPGALEEFERRRSSSPPPKPQRRRLPLENVIEFFK